jgi:S1/P1 Nuclease
MNGTELSYDYYTTRLPVVRERLAVAGLRLAMTLEVLFANYEYL